MATVLVVDDDPAIREYVGDILELEGHTVRFAADGLPHFGRSKRIVRIACCSM